MPWSRDFRARFPAQIPLMVPGRARATPELVIFIGLQGSGKSSFYRARFAATHVHVSKDLLRNSRDKGSRQREKIAAALRQGHSVVVDNTHPAAADRAPLFTLGRQFDAQIVGYFFDEPIERCLVRNRRRAGRTCVPEVALYVTRRRLEPPTLDEGFDALYLVRPLDDGTFEVTPMWPPPSPAPQPQE